MACGLPTNARSDGELLPMQDLWEEWTSVQLKSLQLSENKQYSEAVNLIEQFLAGQISPELRSEAIAFRALMREEDGDLDAAKEDLLAAHSLSLPGSYPKYCIELTLARLYESSGEKERSAEWHVKALETVVDDPMTSGATAILGLLRLKPFGSLNERELILCERVARQAWQLFSLPGEPNIEDLVSTANKLMEAATRPLPRARLDD